MTRRSAPSLATNVIVDTRGQIRSRTTNASTCVSFVISVKEKQFFYFFKRTFCLHFVTPWNCISAKHEWRRNGEEWFISTLIAIMVFFSAEEEHLQKSDQNKKCNCDICGKELSEPSALRNHRKTHLGKCTLKISQDVERRACHSNKSPFLFEQ